MTNKITISVPITVRQYDDGSGWIAVCPGINGAMVDGETEQEAIDAMLNGNPRRPRPRDHRRGEERWVIAR